MTEQMLHAVLYALYALARADRPADAGAVARATGSAVTETAQALVELERRRLVDASRARLTMRGLAIAVSQSAKRAAHQVQVRETPRASSLPPRPSSAPGARARRGRLEAPRPASDHVDTSE